MTDVSDMMDFQRKFDAEHGWQWSGRADGKIQHLQVNAIGLTGEVGEFANVLKKLIRHGESGVVADEDLWNGLREELTDVFIYLLKLADLLGMNLEKSYFEKMAKNAQRFKKFEVAKCQDAQNG